MKKQVLGFLLFLYAIAPNFGQTYTLQSFDGTVSCAFGNLPYRVYYPQELTSRTCVIHVSRGGNGLGDDRGQLMSYVQRYVQEGYVVVQVDHRFAGNDVPLIAQYRGEEIKCIAGKVADGTLNYGSFRGTIDGSRQGYAGHSGGCMEGLEAAGTGMTHGSYLVPQIKAVYGMSPAGNMPDQFGIQTNPSGFGKIDSTAIFLILGELEKDVNGAGGFMATDWRLQTYNDLNTKAPRYQAFVRGQNTEHNDIAGQNADILRYNLDNSVAFFNTYVKGMNQRNQIGNRSLPPNNPIVFSQKGTGTTSNSETYETTNLSLTISPNPVRNQLNIAFFPSHLTPQYLTITDARGQVVLTEKQNFKSLDINHLKHGIYILQLTTNQGVLTKKFVKL